jgi:hypothetical protein
LFLPKRKQWQIFRTIKQKRLPGDLIPLVAFQ